MNIALALLGAIVTLATVILGLPFLYGYRVEDRAVDILLFHAFRVYRLPFQDIEFVKKATWRDVGVGGGVIRFGNRFARQCVLVQKKTGRFRQIVLTPHDPDRFISQFTAG